VRAEAAVATASDAVLRADRAEARARLAEERAQQAEDRAVAAQAGEKEAQLWLRRLHASLKSEYDSLIAVPDGISAGKSSLDVQGVDFTSSGLSLSAVPTTGTGANFQADADITTTLNSLNTASNTLRAQSSTFGSNLSIVQNRQDFSKNLINILDTGSANLTNADLNEEAANSQALSTRQSLGISALSLANQAQQGILQLLR
jgi:flagellin-like hook-associated protein FlgL